MVIPPSDCCWLQRWSKKIILRYYYVVEDIQSRIAFDIDAQTSGGYELSDFSAILSAKVIHGIKTISS